MIWILTEKNQLINSSHIKCITILTAKETYNTSLEKDEKRFCIVAIDLLNDEFVLCEDEQKDILFQVMNIMADITNKSSQQCVDMSFQKNRLKHLKLDKKSI